MTEYPREPAPEKSLLVGMVIGAVAGVAATLFLAPESGKETRKKVKKQLKKVENHIAELQHQAGDQKTTLQQGLEKAAKYVTDEIEKKAKDEVEHAKALVVDRRKQEKREKKTAKTEEVATVEIEQEGIQPPAPPNRRQPKFFKGI